MRVLRRAAGAAAAGAALAAAPAGAYVPPNAAPDPATLPATCAALVDGTTGGSGRPEGAADPLRAGPATVPATAAQLRALPGRLPFRGSDASFNERHDVAVRAGSLFVRDHAEHGRGGGAWARVVVPACMEGWMTGVGIDGELIIVTDAAHNLYASAAGDEGLESWYASWTMRWGPLFWAGAGVRLPADTIAWDTSNLERDKDVWFLDGAGRRAPVVGVATVFALRGAGNRITYLDPWLPSDESYEVCAPRGGRFRAETLAASGSTMLLAGRAGELYTRQYDFDTSGADFVQLDYAWGPRTGVADQKVQLPPLGWVRQPPIPGRMTTRVSIERTGPGSLARTLRVEGARGRSGPTGYWEKAIAARAWRFVRTGLPLEGRVVARDARPAPLAKVRGVRRYTGRTADGTRIDVAGLSAHCSPATLRLTAPGGGGSVSLRLHSVDGLRQTVQPAGISDLTRVKYGALELTAAGRAQLRRAPAALRATVAAALGGEGRRWRELSLYATRGTLAIDGVCWRLRGAGTSAPPGDVPDPVTGCPAP